MYINKRFEQRDFLFVDGVWALLLMVTRSNNQTFEMNIQSI